MEWIDVNDRLPTEPGNYFIVDIFMDEVFYHEAEYVDSEFREPYYGQDMVGTFDGVTHWMKPEQPK